MQLLSVVVGFLLGLLGTYAAELIREWRDRKRARKNIKSLIMLYVAEWRRFYESRGIWSEFVSGVLERLLKDLDGSILLSGGIFALNHLGKLIDLKHRLQKLVGLNYGSDREVVLNYGEDLKEFAEQILKELE